MNNLKTMQDKIRGKNLPYHKQRDIEIDIQSMKKDIQMICKKYPELFVTDGVNYYCQDDDCDFNLTVDADYFNKA
jgi:hypothetical protein